MTPGGAVSQGEDGLQQGLLWPPQMPHPADLLQQTVI